MGKNVLRQGTGRRFAGRCVAFDLETTGLSPRNGDRIIEIGAVLLEEGEPVAEFHSLIHTERCIHPAACRVHGITSDMLQGHPGAEYILPEFHRFIDGAMLVAHNARFDVSFLRNEFHLLGLRFAHKNRCTLAESRKQRPELPNHRLETVYRHLVGEIPPGARLHRALSDARLTAEIWRRLEAGSSPSRLENS